MNVSWRDDILQKLTPGVARLTIACDPDCLLLEESITAQLRERGFELLVYEDLLAFRYTFATAVRQRWDSGEAIEAIIVLPAGADAVAQLPYALVEEARVVTVGLTDLLPNLSYRITAGLYPGDLDVLWQAVKEQQPTVLGDDATADFILRYVYGIALELVKSPADLLRVLLRRHYGNQRIAPQIDDYLIARLGATPAFGDWPLDRIAPDRAAFLAFLQQRWPEYLRQSTGSKVVELEEGMVPYLVFPGPPDLPFDHDDVRVYIDNLFLEGYLQPVVVEDPTQVQDTWAVVGVSIDGEAERWRRFALLRDLVERTLPDEAARHDEWLSFASRWAELTALYYDGLPSTAAAADWPALWQQVNARFRSWLGNRYAGLHNQPAVPPVMVHHVARAMARRLESEPGSRLALIVLDGVALDQWHTIRVVLQQQYPVTMRESTLFAWIPTITSVSRQAIFAGQSPYFFADTIDTNAEEPRQWTKFWAEQGLGSRAVRYRYGLGKEDPALISELSSDPQVRILGLVVDVVDNITHGMQLGAAGMHNQVRQWTESGYLTGLLRTLQTDGFSIWMTADHGNLEAVGAGQMTEKAIADVRGKRVRIYPTAALRTAVKDKYATGDEWQPAGLPKNYFPLLAPGRTAFVTRGETIVGHGGASIEEVIVPLIELEIWAHEPAAATNRF